MKSNSLMKMNKMLMVGAALCAALAFSGASLAQEPVVDINHHAHSNLADAQKSIVNAYHSIEKAQNANQDQLGGHAQKAKELLMQANQELRMAANASNARGR